MARDFDGTDDTIAYTLNAAQTSLTQISISAWVYPDAVAQFKGFISWGGAFPNTQIQINFDDGLNGWVFFQDWSLTNGVWYVAKPSTGAWTHIVVTYDGSSTSNDPVFYRDGTLTTPTESTAPTGTINNTSTTFNLGSVGSGDYFNGRIAEVGVWNRVLTEGEALQLADAYSPLFIPRGLVMYVPLIGKLTDEYDRIKGTTGTITGTAAISHPRIIYPAYLQARRFTTAAGGSAIKTIDGLAKASVKTVNGLAIASVKTVNGLA